jgi:type II secretory pathway pseudopilin PulG
MKFNSYYSGKDSFTLVELLVVIGILAILTAAVVIILNPAELLKQSRDSKRMTDLAAVNNAIKLLLTQNPDVSLGSASTVYVSLSDSSSTCGSYSLPSLPSGWKYSCATAANLTKTDGAGWIPVNFASGASQLPSLPTDPQNNPSQKLYYAYAASNGRWELANALESGKYRMGGGADKTANDGGRYPDLFEAGSDLSIIPVNYGDASLMGYWNFDEGSGTTARDYSGNGNDGTLTSGPVWQSGANCENGGCLSFDGADDFVDAGGNASLANIGQAMTIAALVKPSSVTGQNGIVGIDTNFVSGYTLYVRHSPGGDVGFQVTPAATRYYVITGTLQYDAWNYIVGVWDGSRMTMFVNGTKIGPATPTTASNTHAIARVYIGKAPGIAAPAVFNGLIDDVRIYSRALSDAEAMALYNATK